MPPVKQTHLDPNHDPNATEGAVDFEECPYRANRCRCGLCAVCGHQKHTSVHGPFAGEAPGSKPWGHRFVSAKETETNAP